VNSGRARAVSRSLLVPKSKLGHLRPALSTGGNHGTTKITAPNGPLRPTPQVTVHLPRPAIPAVPVATRPCPREAAPAAAWTGGHRIHQSPPTPRPRDSSWSRFTPSSGLTLRAMAGTFSTSTSRPAFRPDTRTATNQLSAAPVTAQASHNNYPGHETFRSGNALNPDVPRLVVNTLSTTPQRLGGPQRPPVWCQFQLMTTASSHGMKQVFTELGVRFRPGCLSARTKAGER